MKKYKLFTNRNILYPKDIITKKVLPIVLAGSSLCCMSSFISRGEIQKEQLTHEVEFTLQDINDNIENKDVNIDSLDLTNTPNYSDINNYFAVGSSPYLETIKSLYSTEEAKYIQKYCEMYGIDPNIMICICFQETCFNHYDTIPGGVSYNGAGVGLMQIESPDTNNCEITAHNYLTGEEDSIIVSMENAIDLEKNIQIGIMMFQKNIIETKGNIYLAVQSHNYGYGMIQIMLEKNYNSDVDTIMEDYSDLSWIDCIEDVHNNPTKYISYWTSGSTYGNGDYIKDVLRYCITDEISYYCGDEKITFNLKTSECSKEKISNTMIK